MVKENYEKERKFLLKKLPIDLSSAKWFFIIQWYKEFDINSEEKIKLLIDSDGFTCDIVKVKKQRIDNMSSKKTIEYLSAQEIEKENIKELPFIVKKRAVLDKISIDIFMHSKKNPLIIMEVDDGHDYRLLSSFICREVTNDITYRNSMLAKSDFAISQKIPLDLISLLPIRTSR